MPRNADCRCLCHGTDGNRIGDEYFSCKGCYAANHMDNLPRKVVQQRAKPAAKGPRKPRRIELKEGLRVGNDLRIHPALDVKKAAKAIMENIADAAEELKNA